MERNGREWNGQEKMEESFGIPLVIYSSLSLGIEKITSEVYSVRAKLTKG